ncbi:MAG: D-alanyl-D-alanine carboxypeptidase, partial [Lachnospiraceae bacterium]|nr:D-alanyl-D-alanine carboxypeptidase [Lachnospiraceae bacterium]
SWHFRYVGVDAATAIMKQGITLEEYLDAAAS